ncbi:serine/threonine protein kinase, partial [bacterium]
MSDGNETGKEGNSAYGFDPFGGKTQARWGRRSKTDLPVPEIPGYEVVDHLGSGGMGTVWSARFLALNQVRAVKVLDRALAHDPEFLARFGQEAKALGRMDHPNVVKVYDANAENDPPYIAMDWVEGKTLTDVMGGRPMAMREALPLFHQIGAALDYAHGNGFIHRDLKPGNVMVTREGKAVLIDFGIASWLGSDVGEGHSLTGTTRYLSPETIQGRPATTASDLWAFAVIMYRVLTGTMPFDGKDGESVLANIVREVPREPSNVSGRVGRYLVSILEKDPNLRPKTAKAMVEGLRRAAASPIALPGESTRIALASLAAVALIVVIGVGMANRQPPPPVVRETGGREASTESPAVAKEVSPPIAVPGTGNAKPNPALAAFSGIWYADLGTRFAEVTVEPGTDAKLEAIWRLRSNEGVVTVAAKGDLSEDGKTLRLVDQSEAEGSAPSGLETFVGQLSGGNTRLEGTRGPTDGTAGQALLVRSNDIAMTPYANDSEGFSLQIPTSWTAATSQTGETRLTDIHPIGRTDVRLLVSVVPEPNGRPLPEIIADIESGISGYQQVSLNADAAFAGRRGANVEYRLDQGIPLRGTRFFTYRGSDILIIDAYFPISEEAIWAPVMER